MCDERASGERFLHYCYVNDLDQPRILHSKQCRRQALRAVTNSDD